MPIYEYECVKCAGRVEALIRNDQDVPKTCAKCGGKLKKALSGFSVSMAPSGPGTNPLPPVPPARVPVALIAATKAHVTSVGQNVFTTRLEYQARDTETQRRQKKREPMLLEFRLPEYRQP